MIRGFLILVVTVLMTNSARGQPRFGAPSCLGKCNDGPLSILDRLMTGCSCSSSCERTQPKPTCCEDYWTHCSNSCERRCGKPYHPLYLCQCFQGCTGENCCEDYKDVCAADGSPRSLSSPAPPTTARTTTTPKPRPIEIGYSFITGKEVTCPKGVPFVPCPSNPCNQICELYPNAKCEVNQCGTCEAKYSDSNNQTVECLSPDSYCPDGQRRFDCGNIDLCLGTSCPAFPRALCVPNQCGGCHYDYVDGNGNVVDCEAESSGNICQDDCIDDPCQTAICDAHPNAECISQKTEICGICRASFIRNGQELSESDCDIASERSLFVSGPSKCTNGDEKAKCDGSLCLSTQCFGNSLAICVEDPCDSCKPRYYDIALQELTCKTPPEITTTTPAVTVEANTTTVANTTADSVASVTTPNPVQAGPRSLKCSNGNFLQSCDHQTSCASATCGTDETAICKANPCDGCKPIFFNELGIRINCDQDVSGNTCLGRCGKDVEYATCQCTNDCKRKNNCCSDFENVCLPAKTCKGKCGSPYAPSDICQCNKHCMAKSDCCSDYANECAQ